MQSFPNPVRKQTQNHEFLTNLADKRNTSSNEQGPRLAIYLTDWRFHHQAERRETKPWESSQKCWAQKPSRVEQTRANFRSLGCQEGIDTVQFRVRVATLEYLAQSILLEMCFFLFLFHNPVTGIQPLCMFLMFLSHALQKPRARGWAGGRCTLSGGGGESGAYCGREPSRKPPGCPKRRKRRRISPDQKTNAALV